MGVDSGESEDLCKSIKIPHSQHFTIKLEFPREEEGILKRRGNTEGGNTEEKGDRRSIGWQVGRREESKKRDYR